MRRVPAPHHVRSLCVPGPSALVRPPTCLVLHALALRPMLKLPKRKRPKRSERERERERAALLLGDELLDCLEESHLEHCSICCGTRRCTVIVGFRQRLDQMWER